MNVQPRAAEVAGAGQLKPGEFLTAPRLLPFQFDSGTWRVHYGFVHKDGKNVLCCVVRSNDPRCEPDVTYASPDGVFIQSVVGKEPGIVRLLTRKMYRLPGGSIENVELLEDIRAIICAPIPVGILRMLPFEFDLNGHNVRMGVVDGSAVVITRHRAGWSVPEQSFYKRILDHEVALRVEEQGSFPETAEEVREVLKPYESELGLA